MSVEEITNDWFNSSYFYDVRNFIRENVGPFEDGAVIEEMKEFKPAFVISYNGRGLILFFENEAFDFEYGLKFVANLFEKLSEGVKEYKKRTFCTRAENILEILNLPLIDEELFKNSKDKHINEILPELEKLSIESKKVISCASVSSLHITEQEFFIFVMFQLVGISIFDKMKMRLPCVFKLFSRERKDYNGTFISVDMKYIADENKMVFIDFD